MRLPLLAIEPVHAEGVSPEAVNAVGQLPFIIVFMLTVAFIVWALTRGKSHSLRPTPIPQPAPETRVGSITGDWGAEAKMIKDLGVLEGTVQVLKENSERQGEDIKEIGGKVDKLEVQMTYVPGQTAELVISHLRKSGLIK